MNARLELAVVPCSADVVTTVTGPIRHLCPHVDEVDDGQITVRWRCAGATFELHSLAAYFAAWAEVRISHEDLTDRVSHCLSTRDLAIADVTVTTRFVTAGLAVEVGVAVHGESIDPSGA